MTWLEFKNKVEQAINDAGQSADIEIDYMDFNGNSSHTEVFVVEEFAFGGESLGWSLTVQ